MTVVPYSGDDEEAVRIANDSIYGLGGGVVSGNTAHAFNVARRVRAGLMSAQGVGGELTNTGAGQRPGSGVGGHPGRHRPRRGLWRLQAERARTRMGPGRPRGVHRGEVAQLGVTRAGEASGGLASHPTSSPTLHHGPMSAVTAVRRAADDGVGDRSFSGRRDAFTAGRVSPRDASRHPLIQAHCHEEVAGRALGLVPWRR